MTVTPGSVSDSAHGVSTVLAVGPPVCVILEWLFSLLERRGLVSLYNALDFPRVFLHSIT